MARKIVYIYTVTGLEGLTRVVAFNSFEIASLSLKRDLDYYLEHNWVITETNKGELHIKITISNTFAKEDIFLDIYPSVIFDKVI